MKRAWTQEFRRQKTSKEKGSRRTKIRQMCAMNEEWPEEGERMKTRATDKLVHNETGFYSNGSLSRLRATGKRNVRWCETKTWECKDYSPQDDQWRTKSLTLPYIYLAPNVFCSYNLIINLAISWIITKQY